MRTPLLPPPGLPADHHTVAGLFSALAVQPEASEAASLIMYDTPDRRLWAAGLVLERRPRQLALRRRQSLGGDQSVAMTPWRATTLPRLLETWPAGPLKDALLPVVEVRALLPLLACQVERHPGVLLDDQRKTVARVVVHLVAPESGERRLWLVVEGLRGYGREHQAAVGAMLGRGWREAGEEPMALLLAEVVGEQLEEAPDFPAGGMPAGEAMRSCLRRTLQRLAALEPGVIDDIDTEFLHQHRVLLRRVRSLTAQFKGVFCEADAVRLRAILAGWARSSNPVRDLDVWMLARAEHAALVPEVLRPGLEEIFAGIVRDRRDAHRTLAQRLSSPVHSAERDEVTAMLDAAGDGPDAGSILTELAARRTWRAYRRLAAEAAVVDASTPAETVHQVRIRCKRLRYLLDACGPFTAPEFHQRLREQLKAVQGVLGAFNDISLQSAALLSRAASSRLPATQLAVGALVGALDGQRTALHDKLLLSLAELCCQATRSRYRRLFRIKAA